MKILVIILVVISVIVGDVFSGKYMHAPSGRGRVFHLDIICDRNCVSGNGAWRYELKVIESVRRVGGNVKKSFPLNVYVRNLLDSNLGGRQPCLFVYGGSCSLGSGVFLSGWMSGYGRFLRNVIYRVMPVVIKNYVKSGEDKVLITFKFEGSDGRWVAFIGFWEGGVGMKPTKIFGFQPLSVYGEDFYMVIVEYLPRDNEIDTYVNEVFGELPLPPTFMIPNVLEDGEENVVKVWAMDNNGNIVYSGMFRHDGRANGVGEEGFELFKESILPSVIEVLDGYNSAIMDKLATMNVVYVEIKSIAEDFKFSYDERVAYYVQIREKRYREEYDSCCYRAQNGTCVGCFREVSYIVEGEPILYRIENLIGYEYKVVQDKGVYFSQNLDEGFSKSFVHSLIDPPLVVNFKMRKEVLEPVVCVLPEEVKLNLEDYVINPGRDKYDLVHVSVFNKEEGEEEEEGEGEGSSGGSSGGSGGGSSLNYLSPLRKVIDVIEVDTKKENPVDYNPCSRYI